MTIKTVLLPLLAAVSLSACQSAMYNPLEPETVSTRDAAPPGAEPGTCWGQDETPAVVETVTEQVMLQPAEIHDDGTVAEPAIYKTETRQQIVKERKATWFQTPCEADLTPEFNASLQRALKARGHYKWRVTGRMDAMTRIAVRSYQKPQGLDSGMISLAAARQLGLVAIKTEPTPEQKRAERLAKLEAEKAEKAALAEAKRAEQEARKAEELARAEEAAKAAEAAKLEDAQRKAEQERLDEEKRLKEAQEAYQAEEARRAAAEAQAAKEAEAQKAAQAEKAKRAAELAQALEDERRRKGLTDTKSLPMSSETY